MQHFAFISLKICAVLLMHGLSLNNTCVYEQSCGLGICADLHRTVHHCDFVILHKGLSSWTCMYDCLYGLGIWQYKYMGTDLVLPADIGQDLNAPLRDCTELCFSISLQ